MNDDDEIPEFEERIITPETPAEVIEETVDQTPSNSSTQDIIKSEEVPPETVEITEKTRILSAVEPQDNKYWHFRFKNQANQNQLTQVIQNIPGYNLTVEYGIPQNTPDITLKQGDKTVGKIHLLLCDRRDANVPAKYYCKIYFYHFHNPELFDKVKGTVVAFFETFKNSRPPSKERGGRQHRRTHKKKSIHRRKKTARRN